MSDLYIQCNNNFIYFSWTAGMMSDIVYLLSRSGRIKDGFKIVQQLQRLDVSIGVPSSPDSLIYFSKMAIKYQSPSFATVNKKYCIYVALYTFYLCILLSSGLS